jgi:predicted transcriptional regulator
MQRDTQGFFHEVTTRMPSVLAMAKDLVMAQIRASHVSPDAMQTLLRETHAHLMALKAHEEGRSVSTQEESTTVPAPVDWRKSITTRTVRCLECGASMQQLSIRHLHVHGLEMSTYRTKYGIPRTQPLAATAMTAQRQQRIQQFRPWEKAPLYRKAQERKAAAEARAAIPPRQTRKRPPTAR